MGGIKTPKHWRIVPEKGGTVCLQWEKGDGWGQSSTIVGAQPGFVKTASGSVYELRLEYQHPSLWELQLQLRRPEKYKILVENGVL
jgi:hypothetical protein